jgi:hypothetical protein
MGSMGFAALSRSCVLRANGISGLRHCGKLMQRQSGGGRSPTGSARPRFSACVAGRDD